MPTDEPTARRKHSGPGSWLTGSPPARTPIRDSRRQPGLDPTFEDVRAWATHYALHSFKVRYRRLGSIESHPDFE